MTSNQLVGFSEDQQQYYERYMQWHSSTYGNISIEDYEIYLEQNNQDFQIDYEDNVQTNNNQCQYTYLGDLANELENQQLHQFNSNICVCYNQDKKIIQAEQVYHKVQIKNGIGINTKLIDYVNDAKQNQNINFLIQVPKNVTVIQISAKLGNDQFQSVVKQKQKDQENKEQFEDFSDVINIFLGQVEPLQKIQVSYEYVETLKVKFNQLWIIQINPLLENYQQSQLLYLQQYFNYDNSNNNTYNMKIDLEFDKSLQFYRSPTHQIDVQTNGENQIISWTKNNQDLISTFILLFQFQEQYKPQLLLTHSQNEHQGKSNYCATIQILPQLHQLDSNDAYKAYQEDNDIDNQEFNKNSKGEYIFILDRSQSMDGSRLEKAKHALILFLKSLPIDSYYNIVSFGYGYLYQYSQTARYSEALIIQSIAYINSYVANYGGTDISQAIQAALKLKRIKGYNRNIFLLTDGESKIEPVLQLVEQHSKPDVRFYSIGIGQECDKYMMEKIAFLGNGQCGMINDSANLNSVVIKMLKDSIIPWYQNFKITTNIPNDQIKMISSQMQKANFMQKNKPIVLQILFNLGQEEKQGNYFKISYQGQDLDEQVIQIPIDENKSISSEMMHKVAIKQEIQKIQESVRMQEDKIENLCEKSNIINKSDLLELSLNYQVITPLTSLQSEKVNLSDEYQIQKNPEVQVFKQPLEDFFQTIPQQKTKQEQWPNLNFCQNRKQSKLHEILGYFHPSGYFKTDVLDILNLNLQDFSIIDGIKTKCQLNILILDVLETQFNESKEEWQQIYMKALNYLSQKQVCYQNYRSKVNIPVLDFSDNNFQQNNQQYEVEQIQHVDNFQQFIKSQMKDKRFQKIQSTFIPDGQIDESILMILEYDKEKLVCGNSFGNQLSILFMATLENIFYDFKKDWQNQYNKVEEYLIKQNDSYNQYKEKVSLPVLHFNKNSEQKIQALIEPLQENLKQKLKQYEQQQYEEERRRFMKKRLEKIISTFGGPSYIDKSLIIIVEFDQNENYQNSTQIQLCIIFLITLQEIFKDYQEEWKDKTDQIQQYLQQNNVIYDEQKMNFEVPKLHFDKNSEEKIENKLIQWHNQQLQIKRLIQVRLTQILSTFNAGQINEELLIVLECDQDQSIHEAHQLQILFTIVLEQIFQAYKIEWKDKYDQVIQILIYNNVNYDEEKNKIKIPKLNIDQAVQLQIDKKLRIADLQKKRQNELKENLNRFMSKRLNQILQTFKADGQIDQSLSIILEQEKEQPIYSNIQSCVLFLATLEYIFQEYQSKWIAQFDLTLQYLKQQGVIYQEIKEKFQIPNLKFDQKTQEKIEKKLNDFKIQEQIKAQKLKKQQLYEDNLKMLRKNRLNQITSTLKEDGQIDTSLLVMIECDQQQNRSNNEQLCLLFLITLEQIFSDFKVIWNEKYDQVMLNLMEKKINYDEEKNKIKLPKLNFDQKTENQIEQKLKSLEIQKSYNRQFKAKQKAQLEESQRNQDTLRRKRLDLILKSLKEDGEINEQLLIILEFDQLQRIKYKKDKNKLFILFIITLQCNFNDYQNVWQDKYVQVMQNLIQNNVNYEEYKKNTEIPKLNYEQQVDNKIDQLLQSFAISQKQIQHQQKVKQEELQRNLDILMRRRLDLILQILKQDCELDEQLLIALEFDKDQKIIDKNDKNQLQILFIITLEGIFKEYQNVWQDKYDQVKNLISKNVNYEEYKNKIEIPKLNFDKDLQIKIENKLNQQKNQPQQNNTLALKSQRFQQIIRTYKGVGQIEQSLLIIIEYQGAQGPQLQLQLGILFMAVLEKYFFCFKYEWKQKFQDTQKYLEQNDVDYKTHNIDIPIMHFDQQTCDEMLKKFPLENNKKR